MAKIKKRRKSSRFRGSQTAHRGSPARTRGSGNQGGKGWSGTGKRGDQKNSLVVKLTGGNNYFGKDKTLRRGTTQAKLQAINVGDLEVKAASFTGKDGIVNFTGYKILGEGELTQALKIKASAASKSAIEKIKAAKGTLTLPFENSKKSDKLDKSEKRESPKELKEDKKEEVKESKEELKKEEKPIKTAKKASIKKQ